MNVDTLKFIRRDPWTIIYGVRALALVWFVLVLIVAGCTANTAETSSQPIVLMATPRGSSEFDGPSSLDEVIFHSDLIARVSLVSAEPTIGAVNPRNGKSGPKAMFVFRFQVMEYIKGSGGKQLVVRAGNGGGWHDTIDESNRDAWKEALDQAFYNERDSRWDDREALVFLENEDEGYRLTSSSVGGNVDAEGAYQFTSPEPDQGAFLWNYAVSHNDNKAWLPAASSAADASGENGFLIDALPKFSEPNVDAASRGSTTSVADVRRRIKAIETKIAKKSHIAEYSDCLSAMYRYEAYLRSGMWRTGANHIQIASGVHRDQKITPGYTNFSREKFNGVEVTSKWWTSGPDARFFEYRNANPVPPEHDPSRGIAMNAMTTRPLVSGEYRIFLNNHPPYWQYCEYEPEFMHNWLEQVITVIAPTGTLHEAFFDPVALTNPSDGIGVRYSPKTSFTLPDKTTVTLDYLYYAPGIVKMGTTPHNALSGYEMDIIELDGKVSSTFAFGGSGNTSAPHEWANCVQPWGIGDKLMLRIRETGMGGASESAVTPCLSDTPNPTAD